MPSLLKKGKEHTQSSFLVNFWKRKIARAKNELVRLSKEQAKVELDFKSLGITSEVNESTLYLNPLDEGLSAQLYAWKLREPLNTHFLSKFILAERGNVDAVVDIGSNIGYFPLVEIASGAPLVIAIEPVPETFAYLIKNISRFENARTLNVAISDKKEIVKMHIPTKLNLATILGNTPYLKMAEAPIKEVIDVRSLPLRNILVSENLQRKNVIIRMDIEGFEKKIITKLPEEVYGLSFEFHSYILGYDTATTMIEKMKKNGYSIQLMTRELDGLAPIIKVLGINKSLRLYERLVEKRVYHEPSLREIKDILKEQRENPHIFAVRK
ncbi:MAG: FkbM family methyltransferase [Candidatus Hodarchaeota archaeon]